MRLSIRQNDYWRSSPPKIHKPWFSNLSGLDITVKTSIETLKINAPAAHHPIIPSSQAANPWPAPGVSVSMSPLIPRERPSPAGVGG